MGSAYSFLQKEGHYFRSKLTNADVAEIKKARNYFHLTAVIPMLLYYIGTSDSQTKFPATISFTIRKGIPRLAHHSLWLLGWSAMYGVFHRAGSRFLKLFAMQMWLTGVICTFICRVGQGKLSDTIHFFTAAAYMIDHVILFVFLNTKRRFQSLFYFSFYKMATSLRLKKQLQKDHDLHAGEYTPDDERHMRVHNLNPKTQKELWWTELSVMFFENMLFTSFVSGMTSNLE